jgi:hypothetical protein
MGITAMITVTQPFKKAEGKKGHLVICPNRLGFGKQQTAHRCYKNEIGPLSSHKWAWPVDKNSNSFEGCRSATGLAVAASLSSLYGRNRGAKRSRRERTRTGTASPSIPTQE